MKTIFEQQGVEYRQAGDYMLPNVGMGEQKEYQIGVWGQRYKRHLKSNHRVIYYNYLTSGRLYEHLAEVDTRAEVMFHELVKTLAEKENVTEKLKAENTLLWIRKMNNIRNRATEIVNVEVIYVHSEIIKNLIRLKNKLQSEGRYTDAVDDLIIKFSSAKMKSIQIK